MPKQTKAVILGSKTAKAGFQNEKDVINIFNNWEDNEIAQQWLSSMGYQLNDIQYVKAEKVKGQYKADIQVRVRIIVKLKLQEDL